MLDMLKVTKVYRTERIETHALSELTLQVKKGDFVAIMGPSGSGKTTFLNVAGLLDGFESGRYTLDGEDVSRLSDDQMSRVRNRKIGFVFQTFNLIPDLHVADNVEVPLRYRGIGARERKERVDRALEAVGLLARRHHHPAELSGGQQQRVSIARVLAGDPPLILADEPTGNLDSLMAREIMDLLERINGEGSTVIMVTHSPECSARAARVLHVLDGRLIDPAVDPSLLPPSLRAGTSLATGIR